MKEKLISIFLFYGWRCEPPISGLNVICNFILVLYTHLFFSLYTFAKLLYNEKKIRCQKRTEKISTKWCIHIVWNVVRTVGNNNFIQLPVYATATLSYLQFTGNNTTSYHSKHFSYSFSCNVSYTIKYMRRSYR